MSKNVKILQILVTPSLLAVYMLAWIIHEKTKLPVEVLPGLLLIFYLPGYYLSKLIPVLNLNLGKIGQVALRIFYSFCFVSLAGYAIQTIFGFNSNSQLWIILAFDLLLYLFAFFLPKTKFWPKFFTETPDKKYQVGKNDIILLFSSLVLLFIPVFINSIVQNADNYYLFIQKSIESNSNVLDRRQLFASFINVVYKFTDLDLKIIFRNIFVLLFFVSTLFIYDYLKTKIKNFPLVAIGYLAIFIPPVIATEINIIRPQVAMLVFTLPVLSLSVISIQQKDILPAIVAFIFSLISLRYHELSIILLFIAVVSIFSSIIRVIFLEKKIELKTAIISFVIIFPYLILCNIASIFDNSVTAAKLALNCWGQIIWRWWFLSSYKSIDGTELGWKGIEAGQYYLYNGLILLFVIIIFFFVIKNLRKRLGMSLIIPLIYIFIFFLIAEILPRMGLYFLPNRAWVHLMLAGVFLFIMLLEGLALTPKTNRLFLCLMAFLIGMGLIGTTYVAKNNVNYVFEEELSATNYIKNELPKNSLILSSQENRNLVIIYGERSYGQINPDGYLSLVDFQNLVSKKLDSLNSSQRIVVQPLIVQLTQIIEDNVVKKVDSTVLQAQKEEIQEPLYKDGDPVYFLYSYRKLLGINGKRGYGSDIIDLTNKDNYKNFNYPVAYSDDNVVIYKIK